MKLWLQLFSVVKLWTKYIFRKFSSWLLVFRYCPKPLMRTEMTSGCWSVYTPSSNTGFRTRTRSSWESSSVYVEFSSTFRKQWLAASDVEEDETCWRRNERRTKREWEIPLTLCLFISLLFTWCASSIPSNVFTPPSASLSLLLSVSLIGSHRKFDPHFNSRLFFFPPPCVCHPFAFIILNVPICT